MAGLLASAALLGIQFVAALNAEAGAGVIPLPTAEGTLRPEPSVNAILAPSAGWVEATAQGIRFRAIYSPNFAWRAPQASSTNVLDPVLVHRLLLDYGPILRPHLVLQFNSQTTLGEVDFSLTPNALGTSQTSRAQQPVVQLFSETFSAMLSRTFTPRWKAQLVLPFSYQTQWGDAPLGVALGDSISGGAQGSLNYSATRLDTLTLRTDALLAKFSNSEQLSVQAQMGWARLLTVRTRTNLALGAGRIFVLERDPNAVNPQPEGAQYFAAGDGSISHTREHGMETVQLSLDARVDPFLQTIRPQATFSVISSQTLSPTASFSLDVNASTVTASEPLPSNLGVPVSETSVGTNATFVWGPKRLSYRAGLHGGVRGPHWAVHPFELREETVLAFFAIHWPIIGD